MAQLAEWCGANNLSLNVEKTKEVVMDFRRRNSTDHPPLTIDSSTVERVSSTKFLGVHITEDLTWTTNTMSLSKKAQQRLHFLRRLKRASLPPPILTTFYRGTIESVNPHKMALKDCGWETFILHLLKMDKYKDLRFTFSFTITTVSYFPLSILYQQVTIWDRKQEVAVYIYRERTISTGGHCNISWVN